MSLNLIFPWTLSLSQLGSFYSKLVTFYLINPNPNPNLPGLTCLIKSFKQSDVLSYTHSGTACFITAITDGQSPENG